MVQVGLVYLVALKFTLVPHGYQGVDYHDAIQGVYDKVVHFECEYNLMALREKNFRHIIRKNKE